MVCCNHFFFFGLLRLFAYFWRGLIKYPPAKPNFDMALKDSPDETKNPHPLEGIQQNYIAK